MSFPVPGSVFLAEPEPRHMGRLTHDDMDRAIEQLLRRWWRVPEGVSPARFRRGARALLALQAVAFGLVTWPALLS